MTTNHRDSASLFYYSVIRVVPDPVRNEAVNIGVVVAGAKPGQGRMRVRRRVVSRIRAIHRKYSGEALEASLKDLASALGVDAQPEFGETGRVSAGRDVLASVSEHLNNQLQITPPQTYAAVSVDAALERLFRRYISVPRSDTKPRTWMTRSTLKERIWNVVRSWQLHNLAVEQPSDLIKGRAARHPADIVIKNGHPKAALYALATHPDDRNLSYFFRDSLPTIARDMGEGFIAYAVLPPRDTYQNESEVQFAEETILLLSKQAGVRATYLDQLDGVFESVVERLL